MTLRLRYLSLSAPQPARTARPQAGIQERRAAGAATRDRGAAPTGHQTSSHLAGSGHPRGVEPGPVQAASIPSPRHIRHPAALHRAPASCRWTRPHCPPGRPSLAAVLWRLTLRMAAENPACGIAASRVNSCLPRSASPSRGATPIGGLCSTLSVGQTAVSSASSGPGKVCRPTAASTSSRA
jgi:hypothetical protein